MEALIKMEELIKKYNKFGKEETQADLYHMNCAEVMLRSADEAYQLNLAESTYFLMQGFGGGFYAEKTCGAFSGVLAALGAIYAKDRPSDQKEIKAAARFLVEEFEKEFTSLNCDVIKAKYRDPVNGCNPVKLRAGEVMERVIRRMEEVAYE